MEESSEVIDNIREELATLDKRIRSLRPGLKLEALENRCMGEWGIGYGRMEYWIWEFACIEAWGIRSGSLDASRNGVSDTAVYMYENGCFNIPTLENNIDA